MSVFTRVTETDARHLLEHFNIGALSRLEGIASGIENTNYYLHTDQDRFVLTLFEHLSADELPFFLQLMLHLSEHGIPCPHPVANRDHALLNQLNDKPASIVSCLSGKSVSHPQPVHCTEVGATLAKIHLAGRDFSIQRDNPRGPAWWKRLAPLLLPKLEADAAWLLQEEIRYQSLHRLQDLPRGVIHADLFRDNVLFESHRLTGVIDFYFACTDSWLYDLAITVNDWCVADGHQLDPDRVRALLTAYHALRPLGALERGAWPVMLRAAALRFWVSRLYDLHFPRAGEITHAKDPDHFRNILQQHIEAQSMLRSLWVH